MKLAVKLELAFVIGALFLIATGANAQRQMENLGRGVVAIRTGSNSVFVSWRLLGLDPSGIQFNLYRSSGGGAAVMLNSTPLSGGCNYTDNNASSSQTHAYYVRPVIGGVEQAPSGAYALSANAPQRPMFSIPLRNIGDYYVQMAWVGDLDGDGEYDFVVDRIPNLAGQTQKIEAYRRDGAFLWVVDFGPTSIDPDNIEPGAAAISVGHNDHVTVYDMDGDGRAEVLIKSANGVTFGDGTTLSYGDNVTQFVSVLDGMTGAERARAMIPQDYIADGSLSGHFGIGYLDGTQPSLLFKAKNRVGSGPFNLMVTAWDFRSGALSMRWKWLRGNQNCSDDHQIRIVDVDQDGKDELCDGGYVLDDNGTLLYSLGPAGVMHGDRFHIGDLDPDRPGLEGYAIQQANPSGLTEFYYDAHTGQILWTNYVSPPPDAGRGIAADVDPRYRGYEVWSFYGMRNGPTGTQITQEPDRPWPNFRIWWDGDVLSENLNRELVDKWNYSSLSNTRLLTASDYGAVDTWRDAPPFYGDIVGDWREEIIYEKSDHTEIQIFTTPIATSTRIYTLPHNPEYRNCMTVKGYKQSHMVDYYLGDGMSTPPVPNIVLVASGPPPASPSGLSATPASSTQINLAWTDNATNESGFRVERSADGVNFNQVAAPSANVTNYQDGGLAPATTYFYRVRAFNAGGDSDASNIASATTTAGPPATPSGLTASPGDALVALTWNPSLGASSYSVKRSTTNGGTYTVIAGPSVTNYTDTGLANGTTYYYVVSAVNTNGESADSAVASAMPFALTLYEAENAFLSGPVIASNHSGYSGTGFADYINASGDYIEWTISAPFSGTYGLEFRYAQGSANRPLQLAVNGSVIVPSLDFPTTGSWNAWASITNNAYLQAGNNTVRLTAIGSSGGNVDYLRRLGGVPLSPPVAGFGALPTNGVAPLAVTFTDSSTGSITNRFWNFGDDVTTNTTVTNMTHTYGAGVYPVTLIVSGSGGVNTNTKSAYITAVTAFQQWQVDYFGSTTNPAAAPDADPDADGMSNSNEFLAGTNPTNSLSGLRIISVLAQSNDVNITWATAGGRTNVVQATAGDAQGGYTTNFTDLSGLIILPSSGDTTTNYVDVGGATNTPSRYYRIRLVP